MTLPALSAVQDAYTAIDTIWADAEAQNRPANVAEANQALQLLAQAIGITEEPDGKEGDPLISLALAVARTLADSLSIARAEDPASEYERILRSAEQEAVRNPEAGRALARIADRWLSEEFAAARKRSDAKPKTGTTHFGSPAPIAETTGFERVVPAVNDALNELRALGFNEGGVASYVHHAAVLAANGVTELQLLAAARIVSKGRAGADDLAVLTERKIR